METKKTFFQTFLGTISGVDNEGSAKRITMAFICLLLLFPMQLVHSYCFYLSVISATPTKIQIIVAESFESMNYAYQVSLWMFAGLATIETITVLIKTIITFIRGGRIESEAKINPEQK